MRLPIALLFIVAATPALAGPCPPDQVSIYAKFCNPEITSRYARCFEYRVDGFASFKTCDRNIADMKGRALEHSGGIPKGFLYQSYRCVKNDQCSPNQ